MKKILSLVLVFVMSIGMMCVPAFATEGETTPNYVYYDSANWANYETKSYGDGDGDNTGDFDLGIWTYFEISDDGATASLSNSSGSRTSAALQNQALVSNDAADYTTPAYRKLTLQFKMDKSSGGQTLLWQGLETIKKSTLVSDAYANVKNYSSYTASLADVDDEAIVLYLSNSLQGASKNSSMSLYPICVLTMETDYEIEYIFSGTKIYAISINGEWKTAMDGTDFSSGISCQSNVNLTGVENSGGKSNGCLGGQTGFTFSKYKYEGLTELPIETPEAEFTNISSVKSNGTIDIKFNMPIDPATVSFTLTEEGDSYYASTDDKTNGILTYPWWPRKVPSDYTYDSQTNTYSLSFANAPLHITGEYELTLKAGVAGTETMTGATANDIVQRFTATDDKYYVNESFELYNNTTNLHYNNSGSGKYELWCGSVDGGDFSQVLNSFEDGAFHGQLKTTSAAKQCVYLYYRAAKMPVVDKTNTDVKTAEINFKFSNLPSDGYIDIYTQLFTIKKDENGTAYLYMENNESVDMKIAPVPENEDVTLVINYAADDLTSRANRKICSIKINSNEYKTTADGQAFSTLRMSSYGSQCGIEMEKGMNFDAVMFKLYKPAAADGATLTTAADLWIYDFKYKMYEKPEGLNDYDVTITKAAEGSDITVSAVENAGKTAAESVIVAAYDADANKLLDAKVVEVNLSKLGGLNKTVTLDTTGATSVKYRKFRFDGLLTLKPLIDTVDTEIE